MARPRPRFRLILALIALGLASLAIWLATVAVHVVRVMGTSDVFRIVAVRVDDWLCTGAPADTPDAVAALIRKAGDQIGRPNCVDSWDRLPQITVAFTPSAIELHFRSAGPDALFATRDDITFDWTIPRAATQPSTRPHERNTN